MSNESTMTPARLAWLALAGAVMWAAIMFAALMVIPGSFASAHTPTVTPRCDGIDVSLRFYDPPADNNSVIVEFDGAVVYERLFGTTLSFTVDQPAGSFRFWTVTIDANRIAGDPGQFDRVLSGELPADCAPLPTTTTTLPPATTTTTTTTTLPPETTTTTTVPTTSTTTTVPPETTVPPTSAPPTVPPTTVPPTTTPPPTTTTPPTTSTTTTLPPPVTTVPPTSPPTTPPATIPPPVPCDQGGPCLPDTGNGTSTILWAAFILVVCGAIVWAVNANQNRS